MVHFLVCQPLLGRFVQLNERAVCGVLVRVVGADCPAPADDGGACVVRRRWLPQPGPQVLDDKQQSGGGGRDNAEHPLMVHDFNKLAGLTI